MGLGPGGAEAGGWQIQGYYVTRAYLIKQLQATELAYRSSPPSASC